MRLSDYVLERLASAGARHVFFVPGGAAMHLNDSLGQVRGLRYTSNLHEQASAVAAEAWTKVTNELGVCMTTVGPGATNAVTGVAAAWLDSSPVVFVSGQVKRADLKADSGLRMLGVQELDIVSIVQSITKYAVTVTDPSTVRFHLEKAIHLALAPRRGPVWIDIPLDVQAADITPDDIPGFLASDAATSPRLQPLVSQVVALMRSAERPALLAGNGIRLAGALTEFDELLNRLHIPVLTTWQALDVIPHDHPLFAGRPGSVAPRGANFTLQNCDLLLSIGSRLDMALTAYAHDRFARGAKKILVDVDQPEIDKMRMRVDIKIVSDAKAFLEELLVQLNGTHVPAATSWLARVRQWKSEYPVVLPEHLDRTDYVSTYAFSKILSEELAEGDIVCSASSGAAIEIFLLCYEAKAHQRVFHNRGTGAMGFALPAAVGASVAGRNRRTICVDGDGGFQFNIQELETIRRSNLAVTIFVLNNQGYSSIRTSQQRYFKRLVGSDPSSGMTLPDTLAVAEAYGVEGFRLSGGDDVRAGIRRALSFGRPVVVDVMVPPEETRQPSVVSTAKPDGSMSSKPLEDLWPFLSREEFLRNMIVSPVED
jgi:acetolactate synthase I/II/III large subunit